MRGKILRRITCGTCGDSFLSSSPQVWCSKCMAFTDAKAWKGREKNLLIDRGLGEEVLDIMPRDKIHETIANNACIALQDQRGTT